MTNIMSRYDLIDRRTKQKVAFIKTYEEIVKILDQLVADGKGTKDDYLITPSWSGTCNIG